MKLPIPIIHLPHPSSRHWARITLMIYAGSGFVTLALIAIGYTILR